MSRPRSASSRSRPMNGVNCVGSGDDGRDGCFRSSLSNPDLSSCQLASVHTIRASRPTVRRPIPPPGRGGTFRIAAIAAPRCPSSANTRIIWRWACSRQGSSSNWRDAQWRAAARSPCRLVVVSQVAQRIQCTLLQWSRAAPPPTLQIRRCPAGKTPGEIRGDTGRRLAADGAHRPRTRPGAHGCGSRTPRVSDSKTRHVKRKVARRD